MEFSPANPIVQLCIKGMAMEDTNRPEEALNCFSQAWDEASDDLGKFLAAHFLARSQKQAEQRLKWLNTALEHLQNMDLESAGSALPSLYSGLAEVHEALGNLEDAKEFHTLAGEAKGKIYDKGPFYHGTRADLKTGDLLTPGGRSNYQTDLLMNHIYFTALPNGAGLAAALASGEGRERVYVVEPTGAFESDPNVTDKKFPGNPTRSYRSEFPLKIVGEIHEWVRMGEAQLQQFKNRLENNKGEIIN